MKKILIPSMVALGLMACSESSDSVAANDDFVPYKKGDQISLWQHLEESGIAEYFEEAGIMPVELATPTKSPKCENGLRMDGNTIYFDEMEGIYQEGTLVDGVCGKAVSLKSGEVAPLSINMALPMEKGTIEFWFKPSADFFDENARTLLGNDEGRAHFFVKDHKLIFQKNHSDKHFFVTGGLELKDGWNKIAGQWDGEYMSLWVNDEMIGKTEHPLGYVPSERGYTYGNLMVIGYKSSCCMEGPGQYRAMSTSGAYDQVRISTVPRYTVEVSEEPEISSSSAEVVEDTLEVSSSSAVPQNALFFEDFDRDFEYGIDLVKGVFGNGGLFADESKLVLEAEALNDSIPQGTFEFDFKPGQEFNDLRNAALVGSDEGRLTFQKVNGELRFYKNLADNKIFVGSEVVLDTGWNKIAGQWDGNSISLYINGKQMATKETNTGYSPSTRSSDITAYGNSVVVGYKSYCCTSGDEGYTDGTFDNILVTSDLLYKAEEIDE